MFEFQTIKIRNFLQHFWYFSIEILYSVNFFKFMIFFKSLIGFYPQNISIKTFIVHNK